MDPCLKNTSIGNARIIARVKLGVPERYTKGMTVENVCKAIKLCRSTTILPPMNSSEFGGKRYMIDPKSPISAKDFVILFGKGDITRIARVFGLSTEGVSRINLKSNIIQALEGLNISEPIEIPTKKARKISNNMGPPSNNMGPPSNNMGPPSNNMGPPPSNNNSKNQTTPNVPSPPSEEEEEPPLNATSGEQPYNQNVAPNAFVIPKTHPNKVHVKHNNNMTPSFSSGNNNSEARAIKQAAAGQERTLSNMGSRLGNVHGVVNERYGQPNTQAIRNAIG